MNETRGAVSGIVGGRYRIESSVGRGGMAEVFRALDTTTGAVVALKCLHSTHSASRMQRAIAHLEREYHTLCQLAHPRVVTAYDYGVDEQRGPYYTMELLDGGDLQERSPIDFRTACSFARDACSALSLLHSRRMVHRDLSPRNIRCTLDGYAKLIDFGAMDAMGPSKDVVGTPPICAPEIVRMQALDARTDLYALGATLYHALTGRYPYPARSFRMLEEMWQQSPPPPSAYVPEVPAALDSLVMDLVQLDPAARPASAGEVMQRLSAIAGLPTEDLQEAGQAYLSTPRLIGRGAQLEQIRKRATRLLRGRGAALLFDGAAGVGRTRMLDACVVEAKLVGAAVARADATDGAGADYGVMRALLERVLQGLPEVTPPELAAPGAALRALWPDVLEPLTHDVSPPPPPPAETDSDALLQDALRDFLLALGRWKPLALVVDDLDEVDEPSLACLALLAREAPRNALLIATSARDGEDGYSLALELLRKASRRVELQSLDAEQSEALLRSVFGDVPHVGLLAHRLHRLSGGRPRDLMLLAQHLVETRVVRLSAGAWSLPAAIDEADLPESLTEALAERVAQLTPGARALADAMAASDVQRFDLDECRWLAGDVSASAAMRRLDELLASGVAVPVGSDYALGAQGWVAALRAQPGPDAPARHRALARVFERRGDGFRRAQHLLLAGEDARGLDALIEHAEHSQRLTDNDPAEYTKLLDSLPQGWLDVYEHALALCDALGRTRLQAFVLRRRIAGAAAYDTAGTRAKPHFVALWGQLAHDCGLDLYAALDPTLPEGERLKRALTAAQQRHDALPPHERVLSPGEAARQLAKVVLTFIGSLASSLDLDSWRLLPSLRPLAPLSPALEVVQRIVDGIGMRLQGRAEAARAIYLAVLDRLDQPDRAGLDETYWETTRAGLWYVLSTLDSGMGLASGQQWAQRIECYPLHEVNACHGQTLYHLWQGDAVRAEQARARAERSMIQRVQRTPLEGTHLLRELPAHAAADDLMQVKRSLDSVERMARRFPAWQAVLHHARAEHARIRGDLPLALAESEAALERMAAGTHQIWVYAAANHANLLCALGRPAEARAAAERYLAEAEAAGLGYTCHFLQLSLAAAEAQLGELDAASARAEQVIEAFHAMRSSGLGLLLAHEASARIAVLAKDAVAFERYAALIEARVASGDSHALLAKYRRLQRAGARLGEQASGRVLSNDPAVLESRMLAALTECGNSQERAQRTLELLLSESGSAQGFLYAVEESSITLVADRADGPLPAEIDARARARLRSETEEVGDTTSVTGGLDDAEPSGTAWTASDGRRYQAVLLGHNDDGNFAVTGLGVLLLEPGASFRHPALVATCLSRATTFFRDAPPG